MSKLISLIIIILSLSSFVFAEKSHILKFGSGLVSPLGAKTIIAEYNVSLKEKKSASIYFQNYNGGYNLVDFKINYFGIMLNDHATSVDNGFYKGIGLCYFNVNAKNSNNSNKASGSFFGPSAELGYNININSFIVTPSAIISYGIGSLKGDTLKQDISGFDFRLRLLFGFYL